MARKALVGSNSCWEAARDPPQGLLSLVAHRERCGDGSGGLCIDASFSRGRARASSRTQGRSGMRFGSRSMRRGSALSSLSPG